MIQRCDIDGRSFLIDVSPIKPDTWRAQLLRAGGGPTALMPFYGQTPDEAARHLTDWVAQAHRTANTPRRTEG